MKNENQKQEIDNRHEIMKVFSFFIFHFSFFIYSA